MNKLALVTGTVAALIGLGLPLSQPRAATLDSSHGRIVCGHHGTGPGGLDMARGVAIAPSGEIVVADEENHRVSVFGPDGGFRRTFGSMGSAPGQFVLPQAVTTDTDGRIYVADTHNARVQVFSATGDLLAIRTMSSSVAFPRSLALTVDGTLLVLTTNAAGLDGRVERFSRGGEVLGSWTVPGCDHAALTVDATGRVYIAERDCERSVPVVVRLDAAGRYAGRRWVPECGDRILGVIASAGGGLLLSGSERLVTCTFEGSASTVQSPRIAGIEGAPYLTSGLVMDPRGFMVAASDGVVVRFDATIAKEPRLIADNK